MQLQPETRLHLAFVSFRSNFVGCRNLGQDSCNCNPATTSLMFCLFYGPEPYFRVFTGKCSVLSDRNPAHTWVGASPLSASVNDTSKKQQRAQSTHYYSFTP